MTKKEIDQSCQHCGKPVGTKAVQGLCPACLLKVGLGSMDGHETQVSRFQAPSPEDLAELFPQLEIQELIGAGGMGAVYKARQRDLDRVVALKILSPRGKDDPKFTERFTREARALARLSHANIVSVYEFGHKEELYFFIMEYVDGTNLRHVMQAGTLTPEEALAIVPQICEALQFAHNQGVVHRDIKPENILLDTQGQIKIADFGLAKVLGKEQPAVTLTQEGHVMGTPHYMAPEQVEHPRDVDHRADIYSLGVVFYEMLTGELPLGKFARPSNKVQVDVRLDEVVLKTLEKEPRLRYQQVSQVGTEVQTIAAKHNVIEPVPVRTSPCFISTPEYLRTFRGRFWNIHQGVGELHLDRTSLRFSSDWPEVTIPLRDIEEIAIGAYPTTAKPDPIHYFQVTFREQGRFRKLLFTPGNGNARLASQVNLVVQEWADAVCEAYLTHTGQTLNIESLPNLQETIWDRIKLFFQLAVFTLPMFALIPVVVERRLPSRPIDWIWGSVLVVFLSFFPYVVRIWRAKSRSLYRATKRTNISVFIKIFIAIGFVVLIVTGLFSLAKKQQNFRSYVDIKQSPQRLKKLSVDELVQVAIDEIDPKTPWVWQELKQRFHSEQLTPSHINVIVDNAVEWFERDYVNGYDKPLWRLKSLLEEAYDQHLLSEEKVLSFLTAYHGSPALKPLSRLREGDQYISIQCDWLSHWGDQLFGISVLNEMKSIRINDKPVDFQDHMNMSVNSRSFHGQMDLPDLEVGKHVLTYEVYTAFVSQDNMLGLSNSAPVEDWPPTMKKWIRKGQVEFEVYPQGVELVTLVDDPKFDPVKNKTLSIDSILIRPRGQGKVAVVAFKVKEISIPICFDVTLHLDDQAIHCGTLFRVGETRVAQGNTVLTEPIESLNQQVLSADVVLLPNPHHVECNPHADRIWGKEIVFKDVPVLRQD